MCLQIAYYKNASSSAMATLGSASSAESLDVEELRLLQYHLSLLDIEPQHEGLEEAITTPIFTLPVLQHAEMISSKDAKEPFPQYGLLAGMADLCGTANSSESTKRTVDRDTGGRVSLASHGGRVGLAGQPTRPTRPARLTSAAC